MKMSLSLEVINNHKEHEPIQTTFLHNQVCNNHQEHNLHAIYVDYTLVDNKLVEEHSMSDHC